MILKTLAGKRRENILEFSKGEKTECIGEKKSLHDQRGIRGYVGFKI